MAISSAMMESMRAIMAFVMLLLAAIPVAPAAEVQMADGRILEGTIVEGENSETLYLRTVSGRVSAVLQLPRSGIRSISHGPSARQQAVAEIERQLEHAQGVHDLWAAAERLRDLDEHIRFREVARLVLEQDRHHEEANLALGFQRYNGIWMEAHEVAVAQGLVFHEGRWLDWQAFREMVTEENERLERRLAKAEERERRRMERAWREAQRRAQRASLAVGPYSSWSYGSPQGYPFYQYGQQPLYQPGPTYVPGGSLSQPVIVPGKVVVTPVCP